MILALKIFASLILLFSCATNEKKSSGEKSSQSQKQGSEAAAVEEEPSAGAETRGHISGLSNNPYLGRYVNRTNALTFAEKLTGQLKDGNPPLIFAYISANRLGNGQFTSSTNAVKSMVDQLVKKGGIQREVPATVELELAYHALQQNRLAFTEHMLDKLKKSNNKKVRADALNLGGVIALKQDRIPEAVDFFRASLKEDGQNTGARLNLGYLALRGGDHETAKQLLDGLQSDWIAQSAMILVHRLSGDGDAAERECQKVLGEKPTHKPTLFNCGLHFFQTRRNFKQAREYLTKVIKNDGGPLEWNEKATEVISKIDIEEMHHNKAQKQDGAQ